MSRRETRQISSHRSDVPSCLQREYTASDIDQFVTRLINSLINCALRVCITLCVRTINHQFIAALYVPGAQLRFSSVAEGASCSFVRSIPVMPAKCLRLFVNGESIYCDRTTAIINHFAGQPYLPVDLYGRTFVGRWLYELTVIRSITMATLVINHCRGHYLGLRMQVPVLAYTQRVSGDLSSSADFYPRREKSVRRPVRSLRDTEKFVSLRRALAPL
ncbi:hypothetical protein PUN28_004140 [Cardiocondyla obscurior]|uniref:Uncharacterized protein n=1 Tax=Cardiocondyla obscurior TaxID=286306 RepID=A0AAW2GPR1_9HYME